MAATQRVFNFQENDAVKIKQLVLAPYPSLTRKAAEWIDSQPESVKLSRVICCLLQCQAEKLEVAA